MLKSLLKRLVLLAVLGVWFVLCQAAEWKAECNGNTAAVCENRKVAAAATAQPIRFVNGFFPGTKAAEITPTAGLSWPLKEADFNVNKGTTSFWFKPIGWGNGKKYTGKSHFIPVWTIDSKGGFNWAYIAFVSWTGGNRMRLQMQTHGKKGASSIYFLNYIPDNAFLPDQWSLLTFTWSNNDIAAYINGERIGTTDYGLPFEKPFDSHWNYYAFPRLFWKQTNLPPVHICNIKMVDQVLSMQEIRQEYLNGVAAQKTLSSAEASVPQASVPVKVDGTIEAKEWQDAASFPVGVMYGNGIYNSDSAGRLYLKHDGKQLYAALSVAEAKTRVAGTPGKMNTACYDEAVLDFWWGHGKKHSQLGVAPNGSYAYRNDLGKWQDLAFSKAGKVTPDGWSVEFAVPLKQLQVKPGETLEANFCFRRPTVEHFDNRWLVWNLIRTRKPMFINFGKLHFLQKTGAIRVEGLNEVNYGNVKVQVAGGANAVKVQGSFPLKLDGNTWSGTLPAGNGTLRMQVLQGENVLHNQDIKISVVDPVVFSTVCHAAARQIDCILDWRGLVERCRNRKVVGTFTIASDASGKVYGKKVEELKDGKSLVKLPFSEFPAGKYTICAEVRCGKDSWTRKETLNRPDDVFLRERRGLDRTIPPPFKPLKLTDASIETVNLGYAFPAKMPFPNKVTVGGKSILAIPFYIELAIGKKVRRLTPTAFKITESAADKQVAEGELVCENKKLKIRWKRIAAYDGMLKYHLEVVPQGTVTIDRLRVCARLGAEYSRYCLAPTYQPEWPKRGLVFAFPYMHLSGINAGMTFFSDNDANWMFGNTEPLRAIRAKDGNAEISANFINYPVSASKPFTYVLGVMGTPSKQVRSDWRTIHDAGWGHLKGQNLQILFGCTPPMKFMRNQELSMPIDKNIKGWFTRMKGSRAGVTRLVPYIFGDGFSSKTPPAEYYGADWRRTVNGVGAPISDEGVDIDGTPYALLGASCCFNHQGVADYICYHFEEVLKKYPFCGLYMDGSGASQSDTPYPGTSITPVLNPKQRVRNYNIFGKRDFLERLYKIIKKRCGESGLMFTHNWDIYPPCMVSFSDLLYPGEEYMHSIRSGLQVYIEGTPLEKWQSNYNARMHGAGVQFLGQWARTVGDLIRLPAGQRWEYTKPVLMMCVLHDVPLSGAWYPAVEPTWALLDGKKICEADFIGYWMPGGWTCSNDKLKISRYQWKNSSTQLVIVGNLSRQPQKLTDLPGNFTLVDAYTQKPVSLPVDVEGNFGFRILQVVPAGK